MSRYSGRQSSIDSTYKVVHDGVNVIKSKSKEFVSTGTFGESHIETLKFMGLATSSLINIFHHIKKGTDLNVIARQVHDIAWSLEERLAGANKQELVPGKYLLLSSQTERFGNILSSIEGCTGLLRELTSAYDSLEPLIAGDYIDDDDSNPSRRSAPYDDDFYSCADRLFDAISCHCKTDVELRLRLGAFQSTYPPKDDRSLDVLVKGNDEAEEFWLTICLHCPPQPIQDPSQDISWDHTSVKMPIPVVTFADSGSDSDDSDLDQEQQTWKTEDPSSLECICSHARESTSIFKSYLQHVEFDQNKSWQLHECSMLPDDYHTEDVKEYSFPDLFALMNWTEVDKIVLAMQLSYALSYHHGGSWLSGRWQQPNIRFFKWGSRIPCKPWLSVSLPNKLPAKPQKSLFHRFPQLLELGTILLELQIGQTLESFLGTKPAKSLDERWAYATKIYYKKLNSGHLILSRHYRHAIEFCLKPDKAPKEPELLRKTIYENVVLPLEKAISESGLGEEGFESLDLGLIKRSTSTTPQSAATEPPTQHNIQVISQHEMPSGDIAIRIPQQDEEFATDELDEGFSLFGEEDGVQQDTGRAKESDEWLRCLKNIIKTRIKPAGKPVSDRRVKVALLDTGVDLQHSYFQGEYPTGRIKSVRSWTDEKEGAEDPHGGDISGHGTFIVAMLLDICPNIDLYVAKISKSRNFKKGTSLNVANALYYAQKEWAVDIITMSFGFPLGIREIWNQITRATQNNILVFAAASNDGRNQSRMFPARQYSVFAIHSTDGNGIKSGFNPPPERDENFGILGEYIESAWLTNTEGGSGSTRRLSGTSFATPIAVCLSAFLLTYIPVLITNHETLFHKIQSYEGMRNIFQAIVAVDDAEAGSRYQYLGVEKFFKENTVTAISEVFKKALKG